MQVLTLKETANIDFMVTQDRPVTVANLQQSVAPVPQVEQQHMMPASFTQAAPLDDVELTALLMASPFYHKLDQIKKAVSSGKLSAGTKMPPGRKSR